MKSVGPYQIAALEADENVATVSNSETLAQSVNVALDAAFGAAKALVYDALQLQEFDFGQALQVRDQAMGYAGDADQSRAQAGQHATAAAQSATDAEGAAAGAADQTSTSLVAAVEDYVTQVNTYRQQLSDAFMAGTEGVNDAATATYLETQGALARQAMAKGISDIGSDIFSAKVEVNAEDFGLMGDGTDETEKFQAFIDYLAANKKRGVLPASRYVVSDSLRVPGAEGWGLRGMGWEATTIYCTASNIPIIIVGVGMETPDQAGCRMWSITDFTLRYQNHSASDTNANPIQFVAMCYQFVLDRIFFFNGHSGVKVTPGQVVPWGASWGANGLYFNKHLTGGAIDFDGVRNNGPQNAMGRLFIEAHAMTGPIFRLRGHASTIESVEIIWALLGPKLFEFAATSRWTIGAIKLERATYTQSQVMIDILTGGHVEIGQLRVLSAFNNISPSSGEVAIARLGAGSSTVGSYLKVGILEAGEGANANAYAISGGRTSRVLIDDLHLSSGWKLTKPFNSTVAEGVKVERHANGAATPNLGDENVTVTLGSPTTLWFETPLTGARTVALPDDPELLTGNLSYEIFSRGAVNGSNTLTIRSGTRTIYTITQAEFRVVITWRRNANGPNGWIVTAAAPRVT